jgi:hypothetical protein
MKCYTVAAFGMGLVWATPALGQTAQTAGVEPATIAPSPVEETTTPYAGPNGAVIATGGLIFIAAYAPVVAIGAGSGQTVDRDLYIPVAGPFIDLATRHDCEAGNLNCDKEIANKVLLAADGIWQGIGVLTALAGFLITEHAPVVTTAKADAKKTTSGPTIRFAPTMGPGEAGVTALGTF